MKEKRCGPSGTPAPTGCENGATAGQTEGQTPAPTGCVRRGAEYPRRKRGRETMRAVEDAGPYGVCPSGCGISPPEAWKRNDAGRRGRRPLRGARTGPRQGKQRDRPQPLRGVSVGARNIPAGSVEEKRCGPSRTPAPTGCVRRGAEYPRRKRGRETMRAVGDAGPYGVRERGHGRANRGTDPSPYGVRERGHGRANRGTDAGPYEVHDRNGGGTNAG